MAATTQSLSSPMAWAEIKRPTVNNDIRRNNHVSASASANVNHLVSSPREE
jgi:hypothetical protein